jgi:hypothetical protein
MSDINTLILAMSMNQNTLAESIDVEIHLQMLKSAKIQDATNTTHLKVPTFSGSTEPFNIQAMIEMGNLLNYSTKKREETAVHFGHISTQTFDQQICGPFAAKISHNFASAGENILKLDIHTLHLEPITLYSEHK